MYTQKHFIEVAEIMRDNKPVDTDAVLEWETWNNIVEQFARLFKGSNPKFKEDVFLKACGQ